MTKVEMIKKAIKDKTYDWELSKTKLMIGGLQLKELPKGFWNILNHYFGGNYGGNYGWKYHNG